MTIEVVKRSLLAVNDRAAEQNRQRLDAFSVLAINLLGGAGCGKTTLLEKLIPRLSRDMRLAVLEGDLATTRDAERIAALNVPVVQLLTEGGCHLTATLVQRGLAKLPLTDVELVFIENVGNPICPTNFDLGEHARIAILSVTEGDDKPAKYGHLFQIADLVVISKIDLLRATDFRVERAVGDIRKLGPDKPVLAFTAADPTTVEPIADWILQWRDRRNVRAGAEHNQAAVA